MCSHIFLKERTQIRKVTLQKWRHKIMKAYSSYQPPQKPKEIYSAIRKVWWLDNSRAQNPQRRMWISEQSPIRCRGTSSRHSMQSVSGQNFTGDGEEFTKVLVAVTEAKSYLYGQVHLNLANLVKSYHGIIERPRLIAQKQKELQKELYVE